MKRIINLCLVTGLIATGACTTTPEGKTVPDASGTLDADNNIRQL